MESRKLLVFSFMFASLRLRLSDARVVRLMDLTSRRVEVESQPAAEPDRDQSRRSGLVQVQPPAEPFTWKFPEDPVDSVKELPVRFELRQPSVANRVAVRCGENRIQVEVDQDLLGLGKLVEPEDISLGGCSASEVDSSSHVLVFESELHSCGSTLVMMENTFVYVFMLVYSPRASGRSPISRSQSAIIGVECHYSR